MNKRSSFPFGREEKGSAVIILTLAISVLAGSAALVADIGVAYVRQQRLAVAADAAALAGGQALHLGAAQARQAALENAARNGISGKDIEISVEQGNRALSVRIVSPMSAFFAPVLGVSGGGELSALARVAAATPTAIQGAAPLAVRQQDFVLGKQYTLKVGAGGDSDLGPGNFGALALGGPGAQNYEENLMYGYNGMLRVGDQVETQTGNISGPTKRAIDFRLAQPPSPQPSAESRARDCPRLLLVPVYEPFKVSDKQIKVIRVIGFAAFYVEDVAGQGRDSYITGRFVKTYHGGLENAETDGFGISAAKLVN